MTTTVAYDEPEQLRQIQGLLDGEQIQAVYDCTGAGTGIVGEAVRDLRAAELIQSVREYAEANYENGSGWDVVVECWRDDEIERVIGRVRTAKGAIAKVGVLADIFADVRADTGQAY